MTKTASLRRGLSLCLLVLLAQAFSCEGLIKMGRRRIKCTTPIGGNEKVDALMDPRPNLPFILGFVGFQAFLPSLGKCPVPDQIQPPWFNGNLDAGGGICPPEYYNLAASAPGLAIIGAAVTWALYVNNNRLLVTNKGLGINPLKGGIKEFDEEFLFKDIKEWIMTPAGLIVKSSETKFYPLAWDQKSLECLLEDRIPNK